MASGERVSNTSEEVNSLKVESLLAHLGSFFGRPVTIGEVQKSFFGAYDCVYDEIGRAHV